MGASKRRRSARATRRGLESEDAGQECGISTPVACRWFRQAGGMPPISLTPVSGRYLSLTEREEIALLKAANPAADPVW